MTLDRFSAALREGMLSLPQDCKAMLRLAEDPDLDDESRVLACGALLHVLSGTNAIPGAKGTLGFADDVIVLRLVVERIEKASPEVVKAHREDDPEVYEAMSEQLGATRVHLAELMIVLDRAVDALPKLQFEGHDARGCAHDDESITWLYDSVHEAIVERLELKEEDVARAVKGAGDLRAYLKQRV
ncbi:MAG: hypothetical protein ACK6CU_03210 [Deltaproteobacteria bacterium]|jgi:uncharacterized membrane protein YkvA (DUF1232 family)